MSSIRLKFDSETLKHINLFQSVTKATVKDCIIDTNKVLFVVERGQAGLAIGKNGTNIRNMERLLKKKVEVLEFSNDLKSFLDNIIRPIKVIGVERYNRNGREGVKMSIDPDNHINPKSFAKLRIKKTRFLLKKYFNIDDVNLV